LGAAIAAVAIGGAGYWRLHGKLLQGTPSPE
jgi:hypothetical protein